MDYAAGLSELSRIEEIAQVENHWYQLERQ